MPDIEKKIRIQLFDPEFNQISDKLLSQKTVFYKGPEGEHKGPMKIEICLFEQSDIDEFKTYLDKLTGVIPLETKRRRKKKIKDIKTIREDMVEVLKEVATMKDWVAVLREHDFIFTNLDMLEDMGYPLSISAVARKGQRFMVRLMRKAKNPINDKYDPSLIVGFKNKRVTLFSGEEVLHDREMDMPIGNKIKVPAKAKVKFPDYLVQDERNKFRAEMELLKKDPERNPTAFYKRWVWEVKKASPDEIEFPRIEIIPNPYG